MGHPIMKIKDMVNLKKDKIYVTVGTTLHVRVSNNGWYFHGYTDCIKQCYGLTPPFKCRDGHSSEVPIFRYRIDVEVYDDND
ncbi:hypothetical protein QL285_055324 [Trifolium repens]|nr:hypothetical protein QL285_055324 [Trifolium repens]